MKTIQVCIAMIMLAAVPFGCSDDDAIDDIKIPDAEETGIFLEQDLHLLHLSRQDDLIAEEIASLEEELANDPNNQGLQAQLEQLQENREINTERINFLNAQTDEALSDVSIRPRVPRLPPVPPPPLPCTCLSNLDFNTLQQLLLAGNEEAEVFSGTVFAENQEVIAEFGNLQEFEDTGLLSISIEGNIDFQGEVILQITKFFPPVNDVITYSIRGNINL
ncbi:hypothetical protein [Aquimarina litoralis]|uniref:hypothetical protein n=1 Tax=Aquimarina litoralis TaxID=584605 RepID=UPI001C57AA01|nr:hypothetical protein [Aquimarina litoralis]MBW1296178.1 hypothetical protein [Aquimarina litoralis]